MSSLNFKHLRYFWAVAANGSIARAADILHLTPQTISGQLRELEEQLDVQLFEKSGRNLVLTDSGRMVFSYADEMFRLGYELQDVLPRCVTDAPCRRRHGCAQTARLSPARTGTGNGRTGTAGMPYPQNAASSTLPSQ